MSRMMERIATELVDAVLQLFTSLKRTARLLGLDPQQESAEAAIVHCEYSRCRGEIFEAYLHCATCGYVCLSCARSLVCNTKSSGARSSTTHAHGHCNKQRLLTSSRHHPSSVLRVKSSVAVLQTVVRQFLEQIVAPYCPEKMEIVASKVAALETSKLGQANPSFVRGFLPSAATTSRPVSGDQQQPPS